MNDRVQIVVYGQTREMKRADAIEYMLECMAWSEGSEHERYSNVLTKLMSGQTVCSDD